MNRTIQITSCSLGWVFNPFTGACVKYIEQSKRKLIQIKEKINVFFVLVKECFDIVLDNIRCYMMIMCSYM